MMRIKILALGFILLFIYSWAMTPKPMSPEEQDYLNEIMATPLTFKVPKEQANDVWGRIQSWIGKYSSMKIQTATDFVIETYNPPGSEVKYGYSATKTPLGDEVEFEVKCFCGNIFAGTQVERNAHILAYYALTGLVNPKFIDMIP